MRSLETMDMSEQQCGRKIVWRRHSLNDGITHATDVTTVGKRAPVCGYGKDYTSALRGSVARMLFASFRMHDGHPDGLYYLVTINSLSRSLQHLRPINGRKTSSSFALGVCVNMSAKFCVLGIFFNLTPPAAIKS